MPYNTPRGRLVLAGLLLAVLAGGCAQPHGFSFDVTADMRYFTAPDHPGSAYFEGACQAIRSVGPGAFMVSPGDLDPPDRVRATVQHILGDGYVWYPVVGNHEGDRRDYMAYLRQYNRDGTALPNIVRSGPPGAEETCYSFDYGIAHFAAINEYYDGQHDMVGDGDVSDALYDWLAADLAASHKKYIFVFGHEPSVVVPDMDNGRVRHRNQSLDKYGETNHRFWSLLREYNVVAYVCGHTHNASVAKINGVWQLDPGHARGRGDPGARSTFIKVYVEPDGVRCEVYRADANGENYELTYTERLR
jgi:hypothetical protein